MMKYESCHNFFENTQKQLNQMIDTSVGIVIPTMNRPDFIIRQLSYYAEVRNPHSIYIGDASNKKNKEKLQKTLKRFKELKIHYYSQRENGLVTDDHSIVQTHLDLNRKVKEKYCIFLGDDDFAIPDSLTKCAEFLAKNNDYTSVSGLGISVRLVKDNAYGDIRRIADYPRSQIESSTASQRIIDLMNNYACSLFSVQKTENMIKCWSGAEKMKDTGFSNEILHCSMESVLGKSKILDCLGIIRQLDNNKLVPPNTFEWITSKNFQPSYELYCKILAEEISKIDKISFEEAIKAPQIAMWNYLNIWLPAEYQKLYGSKKAQTNNLVRKIKFKVGQVFPKIKVLYKRTKQQPIHEQVLQPHSVYYDDFKHVLNSFNYQQ